MARLHAKERSNLPQSEFGLPGSRKYPVNDKTHARVAKAYAKRYATPSQRATIDAKANRVLGRSANAFTRARKVLNSSKGR